MSDGFDALKLLRQEQADNRQRFAQKLTTAQRTNLKRHKPYTFVGRDADSGNAVIAQNGQAVNAGEITSNALIQPGQSVRVLVAPGKVTVKQLPKPVRATKRSQRSKRIAKLKWLTLIQKGTTLEFYLCGTRSLPKRVYILKDFRETLTLSAELLGVGGFETFTTPYRQIDLSPYHFVFGGVFSSLGVGEDEWLYTFGHSECLSFDESPGQLDVLMRRNRFYKLTPQGLSVFFQETITYGASPSEGKYPSRTYDYYNAGNGFFYRRESLNADVTFSSTYGLAESLGALNTYSYIADQSLGDLHNTQVDGVITLTPGNGVAEGVTGSMRFTPKLRPAPTTGQPRPQPTAYAFEYKLNPLWNFLIYGVEGVEYFPIFTLNRKGTAALVYGRYVAAGVVFKTRFLFSAKGAVKAPVQQDSPYSFNYGLGISVPATTQANFGGLVDQVEFVLPKGLARFKDGSSPWGVSGSGAYLNSPYIYHPVRFGATAARAVAEIDLYDFEWQLQRTVQVSHYVHKPFELHANAKILQVTNVSYSE